MSVLQLKPVNLPNKAYAFTNRVYMSAADALQIDVKSAGFVDVKGIVFSLETDNAVEPGTIALNKVQREYAKIGFNVDLLVKKFIPPAIFELGSCAFEVDFLMKPNADTKKLEIKADDLEAVIRSKFLGQVFSICQPFPLEFEGQLVRLIVTHMQRLDIGSEPVANKTVVGALASVTELDFKQGSSGKLHVLSNKMQQRSIFRPDFNFEDLGIGGLSKEFGDIFRRAFAARVFPPHIVRQLGIQHVKGMLLHGPPGTGKTLIARQLAKFLKAAEPKIVNGPEVLNKYVGQSEENIRQLFADAEAEFRTQGENSQLHIVIFDEIDAICKSRGSSRDGTGTSDSIVNQLLSKIDGVDALDNILLIGMTNRIDLIDEALLRPGRLEMHVEIHLPNTQGRIEILNIHTKEMRENNLLDRGVSIPAIAAQTKNFSGAELAGVIRSAASFALNRKVNISDVAQPKEDLSSICVTREDFDNALLEVRPLYGNSSDEFDLCIRHGITPYSPDFQEMLGTCTSLVEQVRNSEDTPLLSLLLSGPLGCGKTAFTAHLALNSGYPYVRRISSENYVGYSEQAKINAIAKIFDGAYKSDLSMIVLDDLERLIDYVPVGPRFSNPLLQALYSLIKKPPPKEGRRLLVVGTTSDLNFMEEAELFGAFNVSLSMPTLYSPEHFSVVLQALKGFDPNVVQAISAHMGGRKLGIKTALLVAEMAFRREEKVTKETFFECLGHCSRTF